MGAGNVHLLSHKTQKIFDNWPDSLETAFWQKLLDDSGLIIQHTDSYARVVTIAKYWSCLPSKNAR